VLESASCAPSRQAKVEILAQSGCLAAEQPGTPQSNRRDGPPIRGPENVLPAISHVVVSGVWRAP